MTQPEACGVPLQFADHGSKEWAPVKEKAVKPAGEIPRAPRRAGRHSAAWEYRFKHKIIYQKMSRLGRADFSVRLELVGYA